MAIPSDQKKNLPKHLGGGEMRCHSDEGSLKWARDKFNIKTMLDIGCGQGCQIEAGKKLGIEGTGIDGDFTLKRSIPFILHDYAIGPCNLDGKNIDLIWSVEFVEHVEEKYADNFLTNFKNGKYLILTFAPPGKAGHHHVNCQTKEYWIEKLKLYNLIYNEEYTKELRKSSSMIKNFIRDNGLFFINET
jgi:cyclopropane fatty-acyl-phospholipid synthase-like methyltransferase